MIKISVPMDSEKLRELLHTKEAKAATGGGGRAIFRLIDDDPNIYPVRFDLWDTNAFLSRLPTGSVIDLVMTIRDSDSEKAKK